MAIKKEIEIVVKGKEAIDKASSSLETLNSEIGKNQQAVKLIDKFTGGAASKFLELSKGVTAGVKAVKTFSSSLGVMSKALISTGIGVLVVGVGLLIANFEKVSKWVTDVTEKFGGWRKMLMLVTPPIWLIVKALEALGIIDDEATAKAKKNAQERINAQKKESAELDKRRSQLEDYYDFEIRKAKAAGKNTVEVEKQKREALLKTLLAQNELEKAWIRTSKASEDDIKRWNERQKSINKLIQDIKIADIQGQREAEDEREKLREKQKSDAQKAAQERAAEKKALLDIETNFLKQIEDLEDKTEEQRMARAKARALQQIEEMKGTEADKEAARLQILEFYSQKEIELQNKTNEEKEKAEKERLAKIEQIEAEFDLKRRELQAQTEAEQEAIEIEKLSIERAKKEAELIQLGLDEEQRLEILESYAIQEDAIRQKYADLELQREEILQQQKIELLSNSLGLAADILGQNSKAGKAFAVAQALFNTFQGITAELATKTATPFEFGLKLFNIAKASAIGFGAVKNIMKTNPMSASASIPSAPSGGASSAPPPQFNVVGGNVANQIGEVLGTQPPVQAFVVASEVTSQQALDRNIVQNASLG